MFCLLLLLSCASHSVLWLTPPRSILPVLLDRPEGPAPPNGDRSNKTVRRLSRGSDRELIVLDWRLWILPGGGNVVRRVDRLRLALRLPSVDGRERSFGGFKKTQKPFLFGVLALEVAAALSGACFKSCEFSSTNETYFVLSVKSTWCNRYWLH